MSLHDPVFATYVIAATLMILKTAAMSWLTVARMMQVKGGFRSPEDLKSTALNPAPDPRQLVGRDHRHARIDAVPRRTHRRDDHVAVGAVHDPAAGGDRRDVVAIDDRGDAPVALVLAHREERDPAAAHESLAEPVGVGATTMERTDG